MNTTQTHIKKRCSEIAYYQIKTVAHFGYMRTILRTGYSDAKIAPGIYDSCPDFCCDLWLEDRLRCGAIERVILSNT